MAEGARGPLAITSNEASKGAGSPVVRHRPTGTTRHKLARFTRVCAEALAGRRVQRFSPPLVSPRPARPHALLRRALLPLRTRDQGSTRAVATSAPSAPTDSKCYDADRAGPGSVPPDDEGDQFRALRQEASDRRSPERPYEGRGPPPGRQASV